MSSLTATFVVVWYSPVDLDGDYPPWVLFTSFFCVLAYQVELQQIYLTLGSFWTMLTASRPERQETHRLWGCCSIMGATN